MARNPRKGQNTAKADDAGPFKAYEPRQPTKKQGRATTNGHAAGSGNVAPHNGSKEQIDLLDDEYDTVSPKDFANSHGLPAEPNFKGSVAEASSGYDAFDGSVLDTDGNHNQGAFGTSVDPRMVQRFNTSLEMQRHTEQFIPPPSGRVPTMNPQLLAKVPQGIPMAGHTQPSMSVPGRVPYYVQYPGHSPRAMHPPMTPYPSLPHSVQSMQQPAILNHQAYSMTQQQYLQQAMQQQQKMDGLKWATGGLTGAASSSNMPPPLINHALNHTTMAQPFVSSGSGMAPHPPPQDTQSSRTGQLMLPQLLCARAGQIWDQKGLFEEMTDQVVRGTNLGRWLAATQTLLLTNLHFAFKGTDPFRAAALNLLAIADTTRMAFATGQQTQIRLAVEEITAQGLRQQQQQRQPQPPPRYVDKGKGRAVDVNMPQRSQPDPSASNNVQHQNASARPTVVPSIPLNTPRTDGRKTAPMPRRNAQVFTPTLPPAVLDTLRRIETQIPAPVDDSPAALGAHAPTASTNGHATGVVPSSKSGIVTQSTKSLSMPPEKVHHSPPDSASIAIRPPVVGIEIPQVPVAGPSCATVQAHVVTASARAKGKAVAARGEDVLQDLSQNEGAVHLYPVSSTAGSSRAQPNDHGSTDTLDLLTLAMGHAESLPLADRELQGDCTSAVQVHPSAKLLPQEINSERELAPKRKHEAEDKAESLDGTKKYKTDEEHLGQLGYKIGSLLNTLNTDPTDNLPDFDPTEFFIDFCSAEDAPASTVVVEGETVSDNTETAKKESKGRIIEEDPPVNQKRADVSEPVASTAESKEVANDGQEPRASMEENAQQKSSSLSPSLGNGRIDHGSDDPFNFLFAQDDRYFELEWSHL